MAISLLHDVWCGEKHRDKRIDVIYYIFTNYLIPLCDGVFFHYSIVERDIFRRLKVKPQKKLKEKLGVSHG